MTKKRSVTDLPTKVCALLSRDGDQLIVNTAGSADFIAFCELVHRVHFAGKTGTQIYCRGITVTPLLPLTFPAIWLFPNETTTAPPLIDRPVPLPEIVTFEMRTIAE